jgi:hypothetical protein
MRMSALIECSLFPHPADIFKIIIGVTHLFRLCGNSADIMKVAKVPKPTL